MFFIILFTVFLYNSSTILIAADQDLNPLNENSEKTTNHGTSTGDSLNNLPVDPIAVALGNTSTNRVVTFDPLLMMMLTAEIFGQSVRALGAPSTPSNLPISTDPDAEKVKKRQEKRKRQESASIQSAEERAEEEATEECVVIDTLAVCDQSVWLKSQLYLQNRALAYQEKRSQAEVNLKDDLDLWAILVRRGICGKAEHRKTLDWIKQLTLANGSGLEGAIGQFDAELSAYESNINLFRNRSPYNENEINFMLWFTSLPERQDREMSDEKLLKWFQKVEKAFIKTPFRKGLSLDPKTETLKQRICRKWLSALPRNAGPQSDIKRAIAQATHMEIQRYKLMQLQERLEDFYKEQVDALPLITSESIIDFALRPISLEDSHLAKFMEGKHETNEGVEEHPISAEEVTSMMEFIQTHQRHAVKYISETLL